MSDYKVIPMQGSSNRWVIADKEEKIVNDAQGWGYTSRNAASKAMWYHFGGGKEKIDYSKAEAENFWNNNKEVAKDLNGLFEAWFKELSRNEIELKDLIKEVCEKHNIKIFPERYIKYLS